MEAAVEARIQPHRLISSFFLGVSVTLLATSLPAEPLTLASPGWVGLWLVVTLGSLPLGSMLLWRSAWREVPIAGRRGPALAYLSSTGLNLVALALVVVSIDGVSPVVCLPILAGLGLAVLYLRLYTPHLTRSEDLFP